MRLDIIDRLLSSNEPSIRFKVLTLVLGKDITSNDVIKSQEEIRSSSRVKILLSEVGADGRIKSHPYKKWTGAHWVLSLLAEIGYPPGDKGFIPMREQVTSWLFSKWHEKSTKTIDGRVRRHASQEGNALYTMLKLGIADEGADMLAGRLIKWQWPDGGWNCDMNPKAVNSSFHETLYPMRALSLYSRLTGNMRARDAVQRASEVFLKRRMFKRQSDGNVIDDDFIRLHYPTYWHYDILAGLKVMVEAGFISDSRCKEALDLLESKRLDDGGFPAEARYYGGANLKSQRSLVKWGRVSRKRMNEFVTVDALYVLKRAGRLK
ncbi:MAG: hypothetical protein ACUVWP_08845 [bacterium]